MPKEHHNVTGHSPSIAEAARFFLKRGFNADIRNATVFPTAAQLLVTSYTTGRDDYLLAELQASGWAFKHEPIRDAGTRGVFQMLVTL